MHTENQLHTLPGCASKVCVGGGWWVESEFSDRLWLSFSLALAKPNKIFCLTSKMCKNVSISLCGVMYSEIYQVQNRDWQGIRLK